MVDFLVIGPINSISYKNIFPHIYSGDIKVGYNTITEFVGGGVGDVTWFSTFEVKKDMLQFTSRYEEEKYRKYDNYDAIDVKYNDIPYDYEGQMGVPLSFLKILNRNQFEIVGIAKDTNIGDVSVFGEARYIDEGHKKFRGMVLDGKALFTRILIIKRR